MSKFQIIMSRDFLIYKRWQIEIKDKELYFHMAKHKRFTVHDNKLN